MANIRDVLDYYIAYDNPISYDDSVAYSPPVSHPTTIDIYTALGPLRTGDKSRGWPLLGFVAGPGELLGLVDDLARDKDDSPGWSGLLDLNRTPSWALSWLGQFVGVRPSGTRVPGQLYEDTQRDAIDAKISWNRGQPDGIKMAVQSVLTGDKYVAIHERSWHTDGDDYPYRLMIDVLEREVLLLDDVQAVLSTVVPAGIQVYVRVVFGIATWERLHSVRPTWTEWNGVTWTAIHDTDF